jgi:AbrB family looped-hinge helix DNA binding protein
MKSTIDSAGRLVLPKAAREAINLHGGTEVEIRVAGDHIEIEPVPADVTFVHKGRFTVPQPKKLYDRKLTVEEVDDIRKQIQNERVLDTGKG